MEKIMEYIRCVNTTQKKWKDKDYDKLVEWAKAHSLTHNVPESGKNKGIPTPHIQQAAFFVKGLSYKRKMLREGTFRASQSDFEYATEMHDEVKPILDDTNMILYCNSVQNVLDRLFLEDVAFSGKEPNTCNECIEALDGLENCIIGMTANKPLAWAREKTKFVPVGS